MDLSNSSQNTTFVAPRSKQSHNIKQVFEFTPLKLHRKCSICQQQYSSHTSTTNLKRHLQLFHPEALNKEPELQSTYILGAKKVTEDENTEINRRLLTIVMRNNLPLSTFDSEDVKSLFFYANKSIRIWCRQKATSYMESLFESSKTKFISELAKLNSKISISSDIWTAKTSLSYLAITIHYLNDDWTPQNYLLDFVEFEHPHTAIDLKDLIIQSLENFGVLDKLLAFTHDNGANIVLAAKLMEKEIVNKLAKRFNSVRCMAHVLNLIVKEGIKYLAPHLKKIELFVAKLHRSPKFMQEYVGLTGHKIPLDVSTRWNSKFLMLKSVNKNLWAIDNLTTSRDDPCSLSSKEKDTLKEIELFLEPFYNMTTELSSQRSILGIIIVFFREIEKMLITTTGEGSVVKEAAEKMLIKSAIYRAKYITVETYIAIILDPRIKKSLMPTFMDSNGFYDQFEEIYRSYNPDISDFREESATSSTLMSVSILDSMKKAAKLNFSKEGELQEYFREKLATSDTDVYEWWNCRTNLYPTLSKMARDYLGQVPTSVPSERVFSAAVNTLTNKRNKLSSHNIKCNLCLNSWKNVFSK